jgi:hypothetical protein
MEYRFASSPVKKLYHSNEELIIEPKMNNKVNKEINRHFRNKKNKEYVLRV